MQYIKPAWLEGMRITPEHFQQQDGSLQSLIAKKFCYLSPNFWGLKSFKFDNDLLSLGEIHLLEASGILPDGEIFDYVASRDGMLILSKEQLKDVDSIYLGITHSEKYQLIEKQVQDDNNLDKQPINLTGLELNLKLLTNHDDIESSTVIPLIKLANFSDNQSLIDHDFIAPSIDINSSSWLINKLSLILKMLQKKHHVIRNSIVEPMQSQAISSKNDLWILSILNRYICRLELLRNKALLHPEALYSNLYEMLAELLVIYEDSEKLISPAGYDHENSFACFNDLINKILDFLQLQAHHQAIEVSMLKNQQGIWMGDFNAVNIADDAKIVLSLYHENALNLANISQENDIKICSSSSIDKYMKLQLPGLPAVVQNTIPPQIPYHANTNYYVLDTQHALWQQIISEKEISIVLNNAVESGQLKLWIIPTK